MCNPIHRINDQTGNAAKRQKVEPEFQLPLDDILLEHIFDFAFGAPIPLVCKKWRMVFEGDGLYQRLYQRFAKEVFGRKDYIQYIGCDPGEEQRIPYSFFAHFRSGRTLLTYVPAILPFPDREEPCTLRNVGNWALKTKQGHRIGYVPGFRVETTDPPRPMNQAYWSFITLRRHNEHFSNPNATEQARNEKVASQLDASLSFLMFYVKNGHWPVESARDHRRQWEHKPAMAKDWKLHAAFQHNGLLLGGLSAALTSQFCHIAGQTSQ